MNDLDLSSLATGPAPALAPASAVRARGDQRTRRGRALVATTATLVVLAGAGTAIALSSPGKPDSLVPAGPTTTLSPDSSDAHDLGLVGALLQPSDAAAVLGGRWFTRDVVQRSPEGLLEVCDEGGTPILNGFNDTLLDGRGGTLFTQVIQLASDESGAYLGGLPRTAARCPADAVPGPQDGEDFPPRDTVVPLSDPDAFGLKQVVRDCAQTCDDQTVYWVVVAVGDLVGITNTNDPTTMNAWADRMRTRLSACRGTCPPPEQAHPQGFPEDVELRTGDVAWVVTIGGTHPDGVFDEVAPARETAALLGYAPVTVAIRCLDGYLDDGVDLPISAEAVVVPFFTEEKARAFQEGFSGSASFAAGITRSRVTVRCLS